MIAEGIVQLMRAGVGRARGAGRKPVAVHLGRVEWAAFEQVVARLLKVRDVGAVGVRFDDLTIERLPFETIALLLLEPVMGTVSEIDLYELNPQFWAEAG